MPSTEMIISSVVFLLTSAIGYGALKQEVKSQKERVEEETAEINARIDAVEKRHDILKDHVDYKNENLLNEMKAMTKTNHELALRVAEMVVEVEHMNNTLKHWQGLKD